MEPWLGLYLPDDLFSAPLKGNSYTHLLKRRIQILSFYVAWGSERKRADLLGIQRVLKGGFIPMITWEPWHLPHDLPEGIRPEEQSDFSLSSILNGNYDDYLWNWANDLKEISTPIFFRPMHEMNGNWYPWCGRVNGNDPKQYIETWCYLRSIFKKAGNERLIWVWSPYVHSVPDEPGNEMGRYYPGEGEVDWLALDGYNWGKSQQWSRWKSFREIFEEGYKNLAQLSSEKPIMIAEIGCAEEGGDKDQWIEEAFNALTFRFPKIKALIWFNIKKECDWRMDSSPRSLWTFKMGLKKWSLLVP
ncbi:MAG: glycosyl hydrolase [Thermodesulfobacteriota bacterium]